MKKHLIGWLILCGVLAVTSAMAAEGRGKFIRMSEGRIELRVPDRDAPLILMVPADKPDLADELRARARRFQEGQTVEFVYNAEDGKNWLRDLRAVRDGDRVEGRREGARDGERRREGPRDGDARREGQRDPQARLEQLERQVAELREQVLRLRRELEEMRGTRGGREPERRGGEERRPRPPQE
jgi:hypothetical protein